MKGWLIIIFLGILSITSAEEKSEYDIYDELIKLTQRKFDKLARQLRRISTPKEYYDKDFEAFVAGITETARKVQAHTNKYGLNVDEVVSMFSQAVEELERGKVNERKNKRVLKELAGYAQGGLVKLGAAWNKFIEAMKPANGKGYAFAQGIATSLNTAADRLLDSLKAGG